MQQLRTMETPSNPFMDLIKNLTEEEERLKIALEMVQKGKQTMMEIYNRYPHGENSDPTLFEEQKVKSLSTAKKSRKSIPTEYKKSDTYGQKILFLLNKHGEATTPELIQYILDEQPELNPRTVAINVGKESTRLVVKDKVVMEKQGNTNLFRLK